MRVGTNPAKAGLPAYTPNRLGVALIVYMPVTDGYFQNSLEIFKIQLTSLRAATSQPYDLLVFDNGSCNEVVTALQDLYRQGQIDWLVLSRYNLGKAGAWNWIFGAMPNELICYADSDVLFRPGWLDASLEVLEAFPQAGMVAAQPNFFDVMKGEGKAHLTLLDDAAAEFGEYRPAPAVVEEYCLGINASEELAAQFYQNPLPSVRNQKLSVEAVIGASHMQFLIPREVARRVVPLPATKALQRSETMSLDYRVDELGYLHLSVIKPYVFHMGNTINERLLSEVQQIIGAVQATTAIPRRSANSRGKTRMWLSRLARRPFFYPYVKRAYNFLFQLLNADS